MISIFISSTFQDMQEERDILHNYVRPAINEFAKAYGEYIEFIDLRWGIDTFEMDEDAATKKVIDACIESIEKCHPYMIVCMGERYGWAIPAGQYKNKSMTEIEIEEGVFKERNFIDHTLCYFRKLDLEEMEEDCRKKYFDTQENRQKLQELKNKIMLLNPRVQRQYTLKWKDNKSDGILQFAEQVLQDLKEMLLSEWGEIPYKNIYEQEEKNISSLLMRKNSNTKIREQMLERVLEFLEQETSKNLLISGKDGSGKTTLIANLTVELKRRAYIVIPFLANSSAFSGSCNNMVQYFVFEMKKLNGIADSLNNAPQIKTPEGMHWWYKELERQIWIFKSRNSTKVIFLVDEPYLMSKELDDWNLWFWVSAVEKEGASLIFTCNSEITDSIQDTLKKLSIVAEMCGISKLLANEVSEQFLLLLGRKELNSRIRDKIYEKESSDNYLYLKLVYERLCMYSKSDNDRVVQEGTGIEGIFKVQEALIDEMPDSLSEMWRFFAEAVGKNIGSSVCLDILKIIACSKSGMRKEDIQKILVMLKHSCSDNDFNRIYFYLSEYLFMHEDGRIEFANNSFRKALLFGDNREMIKKIYLHVRKLPISDIVYLNEVIYLLDKMSDYKTLFDLFVHAESLGDSNYISNLAGNAIFYLNRYGGFWMEEKIEKWISAGEENYDVFDIYLKFFLRILAQNNFMDRKSVSEMLLKTAKSILSKYALDDMKKYQYYQCIIKLDKYANTGKREEYIESMNNLLKQLCAEKQDPTGENLAAGTIVKQQIVENIQKQILGEMKIGSMVFPEFSKEILYKAIYDCVEWDDMSCDNSKLYDNIKRDVFNRFSTGNIKDAEWTDFAQNCNYGVVMAGLSNLEDLALEVRCNCIKLSCDILERCGQVVEEYKETEDWAKQYHKYLMSSMEILFLLSANPIIEVNKRIKCIVAILLYQGKGHPTQGGFNLKYCKERLNALGVQTGQIRIKYTAWTAWFPWSLERKYATQLRQVKSKTFKQTITTTILTGYKVITYKDAKKPIYRSVQVALNPKDPETKYKTVRVLTGYGTSEKRVPIYKNEQRIKTGKCYSIRIRGLTTYIDNSENLIEKYLSKIEQQNPWLILK